MKFKPLLQAILHTIFITIIKLIGKFSVSIWQLLMTFLWDLGPNIGPEQVLINSTKHVMSGIETHSAKTELWVSFQSKNSPCSSAIVITQYIYSCSYYKRCNEGLCLLLNPTWYRAVWIIKCLLFIGNILSVHYGIFCGNQIHDNKLIASLQHLRQLI